MSQQTLSVTAPVQPVKPPKAKRASGFVPRLLTGIAILAVWEIVVRLTAPAYVAKPSNVAMAIPRVITDPAFLSATGNTLLAVAEGFHLLNLGDHRQLELSLPVYDALYAWCKNEVGEGANA